MGTLSLTDPVNGTIADASTIAANNAAIKTVVNGGLDNTNIASGAAIAASKLANYPADSSKALLGDGTWGTLGAASIPAGAIIQYGAASAPSGWLLCDGSTASRSTYSTLFGIIGTTYGNGDGSTTFNVPDLRGRVAVGVNTTGPTDVNALGNNDAVTLASRNVKHHHTVGIAASGNSFSNGATGSPASGSSSTSGDSGNLDAPAYLVVNHIIKT